MTPGPSYMDQIVAGLLVKLCVMVTITFVLTQTRLFASLGRPKLRLRDQATALFLFLLLALAEVLVANNQGLPNTRIVAVCASGLLAGPWVGGIVGVVATVLSVTLLKSPIPPIATSMIVGGILCGLLSIWRPRVSLYPATGFGLGIVVSLSRDLLYIDYYDAFSPAGSAQSYFHVTAAALLTGMSVALILFVIQQMRHQEANARCTAMAEVRALQARMDPHFLYNALNTLSALSIEKPMTVPDVASRLGVFLRASLDWNERALVTLREELAIVDAFLDIESIRHEDRLCYDKEVDDSLLSALVPPFIIQPLAENAVRHGIEPSDNGGTVHIWATTEIGQLVLTVSDTGVGMAPAARTRLFQSDPLETHALTLLRRRLQNLFGRDYRLEVESRPGAGATVTIRLPLRIADFDYAVAASSQELLRIAG